MFLKSKIPLIQCDIVQLVFVVKTIFTRLYIFYLLNTYE